MKSKKVKTPTPKADTSRAWLDYYDRAYIKKADNERLKKLAERKFSSIPNMITALIDVYEFMEKQNAPMSETEVKSDGTS